MVDPKKSNSLSALVQKVLYVLRNVEDSALGAENLERTLSHNILYHQFIGDHSSLHGVKTVASSALDP
jgi:hypothetical protein